MVMNQTAKTVNHEGARLWSVDALRGLIIILMALDHANYFVAQKHSAGEYWGGSFPVYHDALSFLTRLVTHLAAPGFFLLMGAGMVLYAHSRRKLGWSEWAITRHLLIRGGLLMAIQLVIVNRAWELSPGGWVLEIYIGVLFALGGTMMIGSLLLRLKTGYLMALTVALVIGTELAVLDPTRWGQIEWTTTLDRVLNTVLFTPGGDTSLWSNYPILP